MSTRHNLEEIPGNRGREMSTWTENMENTWKFGVGHVYLAQFLGRYQEIEGTACRPGPI